MFLQSSASTSFQKKAAPRVRAGATLGHGRPEKVPAGSSACNDRVHRLVECDCAAGGSSRPSLAAKVRRQCRIFFGIARGAADPPGNPKSEI